MNPFPDHLTNLYEIPFVKIINYCDICSIDNLRSAFPYLHQMINNNLIKLNSSVEYKTDFKYYHGCLKLEYCSDNITFNIYNQYELLELNLLSKLKHINFYINKNLNDVYESLVYLKIMLRCISKIINIMKLTYRLIFKLNDNDNDDNNEYAYILDRGFFTIVNFNQLRNYKSVGIYRIDWLRKTEYIIKQELSDVSLHECMYSHKKTKNPSGIDLFDENVHQKLEGKDNLIFLIKIDDYDEIYLIDEFTRKFLESDLGNIENCIFNDLKGITREILGLVLLKYGKHHKLFTSTNGQLYFKVWNSDLFRKYFPIKRNEFKKVKAWNIKNKDNTQIIEQMVTGKITPENLVNLIVNILIPVDIIKNSKIRYLYLPPQRSYVNIKMAVNMLDFMVSKATKLVDDI